MAPSIPSPKSTALSRKDLTLGASSSKSREVTPTVSNPTRTTMSAVKSEEDLSGIFRSDLTSIRQLVTCSICDQLLYEPWTLGCGHTYCYSCLCNWFITNRRKKTCPECRSKVKQIPAPNFLVKSMVEIFIIRVELMPADESIDQHNKRRLEEIAEVDRDRNSPEGLFKGTFPERHTELWLDEADGVLRCPSCGHEHEGGPSCQICGAEFDDSYGFSDMDDDADLEELEDLELDLDNEVDAEFAEFAEMHDVIHPRHFRSMGAFIHPLHYHHHHTSNDEVTEASDGSEMDSESDEDGSSLQGFVVADDPDDDEESERHTGQIISNHPIQGQLVTISDDESDEGGAISNRRPQRSRWHRRHPSPSTHSALTVTDTSTNGSEAGESNNEAELRHAGWSPLDQGNDSDTDGHPPYDYETNTHRYDATGDEQDLDHDSDTNTETMTGNGYTDDEDDGRTRDSLSETPTHHGTYPDFDPYDSTPYDQFDEESDPGDYVAGDPSIMDRDGDTEMSASPRASRSVSLSTNPYDYEQSSPGNSVHTDYDYDEEAALVRGERGVSITTDGYGHNEGEDLGVTNEIHDVDDQSSDTSIRPPPRRLPRRQQSNSRGRLYDPRISMIFAEHQQSMRGTQSNPIGLGLDEWDGEDRRIIEPPSRHRRMTAYRVMPPRRVDPLRSSRSPSATRVISSTNRNSRHPRQYVRRSEN